MKQVCLVTKELQSRVWGYIQGIYSETLPYPELFKHQLTFKKCKRFVEILVFCNKNPCTVHLYCALGLCEHVISSRSGDPSWICMCVYRREGRATHIHVRGIHQHLTWKRITVKIVTLFPQIYIFPVDDML